MKQNQEAPAALLRQAKYRIYRDKKKELLDYIIEQTKIWGSYQDIPGEITEFIDREFTKLGIFGKKINAHSMERESEKDREYIFSNDHH
ncbi:MAG TPA: hypothetical protein PK926_12700 [Spirochaetota bacterium]|nr:hypothetical protein [Spirochaetota bacterium]HPI91047.1 hypothetical protein [Spirochaetota bacterium]HPR49083.1 hypothetical protein [Spirochaetota bacterium]